MGVNKVMEISDPTSRRAYEDRAAASRAESAESEPAQAQRDAA
jgi:hypothetical protein